jgi:two-component system OmpR family response regulator
MKRVLITEDDGLIAEIYRDSFDREGFSAEVAKDGAVAIQRLKENPPDIVLLDLMMPNVNGVEVLKFIRSQAALQKLPVIVMSNAFAGALGREAAMAGATRMFAKNACGPKRLVKEVREVLASVSSSDEISGFGDTAVLLKDFRKDVTNKMPQRVAALRVLIGTLAAEKPPAPERLLEVHRAVHQLAGFVSLAGFSVMAQLACALEALVKELHSKPQKANPSSFRTALEAVEMLGVIAERESKPMETALSSPLILVVDDDAISRETACTALEQAHLRALSVEDPHIALKLAQDNRFDLLLMDIQMPEMNGLELCEKIRATVTNAKTPVIFITALNNFEAHARSAPGSDFIAKPVMLVELAVKALTRVLKNSLRA